MKSAIKKILPVLGLFALVLGACAAVDSGNGDGARFSAAVWNVQALYDGEDAGNEYNEYRAQAGWTKEKYQARLTAFAEAIGKMAEAGDGAPDLLALVEVENGQVLKDLAGRLSKHGYKWTFFGGARGMSLGAGALSRIPFSETRLHSISASGNVIPRPVIEVRLESGGAPLVFFICHWKSKLGGGAETEATRRAAARIIRRRIDEIHREEPGTPAIIMGDLNENHDEFYRQSGAYLSALLPDDARAAALSAGDADFLILSGEKPPRARYFDAPALYTPWGRELKDGSYYYKNDWETIDHLLLSPELFDGAAWDFAGCRVLNEPPFASTNGHPVTYKPYNGQGLSDHLPLILFLKAAGEEG